MTKFIIDTETDEITYDEDNGKYRWRYPFSRLDQLRRGYATLTSPLLPANTRLYHREGDNHTYIIEVAPGSYPINIDDPDGYTVYPTGPYPMPWQYFGFNFTKARENKFGIIDTLTSSHLFWSRRRILGWNDRVCRGLVPNVDANGGICLGTTIPESNQPAIERIRQIVTTFYSPESMFNWDIEFTFPYHDTVRNEYIRAQEAEHSGDEDEWYLDEEGVDYHGLALNRWESQSDWAFRNWPELQHPYITLSSAMNVHLGSNNGEPMSIKEIMDSYAWRDYTPEYSETVRLEQENSEREYLRALAEHTANAARAATVATENLINTINDNVAQVSMPSSYTHIYEPQPIIDDVRQYTTEPVEFPEIVFFAEEEA